MAPTPFTIDVPQERLAWIRQRIADYEWFEEPVDSDRDGVWAYGANKSFMQDLARYWLNEYDWRKQEAAMNRFDHFTAPCDGRDGTISVIDGDKLNIRTRIASKPGRGPMRFSQDGRWGAVVNPSENEVMIIDASKDEIAHSVKVGSVPYQVSFTRSFAYVRSLGTAQVGLIPVSELDEKELPPVTYIPAAQNPPGAAAKISIADSVVPSVKEAAAYIVNQAEGTVHYYMEGMGAPMGAFRNYGHQARAIETVDRSLQEVSPGVYTGQVKIPVEGSYDIAFMMDTPRFLHCFGAEVQPNPEHKSTLAKMSVEFGKDGARIPIGVPSPVRFKLSETSDGSPLLGVADMTVLYYRSDGRNRAVVPARQLEDGRYEAMITVHDTSTYYVFVGSRSKELKYTDLPFLTVIGEQPKAAGGKQ